MTIKLELPDTPAMRAVLRQMASLAVDDNAPSLRSEAYEAEAEGVPTESFEAEADANELFDEVVTTALMVV